ncbi:protein kinase [Oryctes borbonicus]|uniref:Protein kinase n=1 Tax=Oryctes borbonicus TaxID=1629725 RepID=A0A0T6AY61_9SCAR|nr:protein kinase [Oryctes borbonicus]
MTTSNNNSLINNMQIALQHPTLSQIVAKSALEATEGKNCNILRKPVRLSVFLKELEEAENEPIPDIKYSNTDETDAKEYEEISELDVMNLSTNGNGIESNDNILKATECEPVDEVHNLNDELNMKWFITPNKQPNFSNFITPNIQNLNNVNFKGSYTQIPNRSRLRIQCGNSSIKKQNTVCVMPLLPNQFSKKKTLFSSQSKEINEVIHDHISIKNKNNIDDNLEKNGLQNVLCSVPLENPILDPFERINVNNKEYVILNQIGRGGSSVVFHCYDIVQKCERAIKRVNLTGDKACIEGYINEVKMLNKLQSCNRIITMHSYEIRANEKILLVVLEKGEKDLAKILKELSSNTEHLPMYLLIYYWMEMLYAVKQIHDNGIIHSDLKPSNFLMVSSKLKLIDFGIASSLQTDMTSVVKNVQIGSFNYISPEALINNSQDNETAKFMIHFKSDVWSLGCILYQLVYRKTPFQHIGHTFAKLSAIIDQKHDIEYPQVDWVPPITMKTLKMCLQYDVKLRPSVNDLIKIFENIYY